MVDVHVLCLYAGFSSVMKEKCLTNLVDVRNGRVTQKNGKRKADVTGH